MHNSNTATHDSTNATRPVQAMADTSFMRDEQASHRTSRHGIDDDDTRELVSTRTLLLREEMQYEDIA